MKLARSARRSRGFSTASATRSTLGTTAGEKAYVHWIKRYILFHGRRHPVEMGAAEVTEFLTSLAVHGKLAAATQNQALSALLFLYRDVLGVELPWLDGLVRAKPPQHLQEDSHDIRTVQELLGHQDMSTTIDLHPRPQSGSSRRPEPGRPDVSLVMRPQETRSAAAAGVLNCRATRDNTAGPGGPAPHRQLRAGQGGLAPRSPRRPVLNWSAVTVLRSSTDITFDEQGYSRGHCCPS